MSTEDITNDHKEKSWTGSLSQTTLLLIVAVSLLSSLMISLYSLDLLWSLVGDWAFPLAYTLWIVLSFILVEIILRLMGIKRKKKIRL